MAPDPYKTASEWFYNKIFREEPIRPRYQEPQEKLPSLLRAARSLEGQSWQSREALFVKQAKLLAHYEDQTPYTRQVLHYFPTFQSLSDPELRGYFAWRTQLRRGNPEKTSLTYAFLYIFELLNMAWVDTPGEALGRLLEFRAVYGPLDGGVFPHLNDWIRDFVVYHGLDPVFLADQPWKLRDDALEILSDLDNRDELDLSAALRTLCGGWLSRSRFYREHTEEMNRVLLLVLRGISQHYAKSCKKTMVEQYFGVYRPIPLRLFDAAVFLRPQKEADREFKASAIRIYRCRQGLWTVYRYSMGDRKSTELESVVKAVDAAMRQAWEDPHPLRSDMKIKWVLKLIDGAIAQVRQEQAEAEAKRIVIDFSRLDAIRADAEHTRNALAVEEEPEEPEVPETPPAPEEAEIPDGSVLDSAEYRLLQCLLYGGSLEWIAAQGLMRSVLTDSINEKLYEEFADSVLSPEGEPLEDYIDDLKELVHP